MLARDLSHGALLLAAVPAARPVREAGIEPSLDAIGALVRDLHRRPAPAGGGSFEPLADRAAFLFDLWDVRLGRGTGGAERAEGSGLLDRGRRLVAELVSDSGAAGASLLHGDLHPGNVFDVGDPVGLVAIDPRPCFGDPAFDLIDWIVLGSDDPATWRERASELADRVGVDPDRAWAWCEGFAAMLAAIEANRPGSARRVAALLEIAA